MTYVRNRLQKILSLSYIRSMFSSVIGQQKIIDQMLSFEKQSKTPHALMISGHSGRGGLSLAISFAQFLLCENKTDTDSCGSCKQCQKSHQLIHPDLHFSFPVVKHSNKKRDVTFSDDFIKDWRSIVLDSPYFSYSDWLNHIQASEKQGDINVTECNEISKKLSLKSFGGGKKILILWLPEFLGQNSNRLLKLIEEPPDQTHLIFVTYQEEALLKTITSRFQIIKLPPIDKLSLSKQLIKEFDIEHEEARRISMVTEGDYIDAKGLVSGANQDIIVLIIKWLRICYQQNSAHLTEWTEKFGSFPKELQKQVLSYTLFILREFIKMRCLGNEHLSLNKEEFEKLKGLSTVLTIDKAEEIASIINESLYSIQRNANVRILMMADSLTIGQILRRKEVSII